MYIPMYVLSYKKSKTISSLVVVYTSDLYAGGVPVYVHVPMYSLHSYLAVLAPPGLCNAGWVCSLSTMKCDPVRRQSGYQYVCIARDLNLLGRFILCSNLDRLILTPSVYGHV